MKNLRIPRENREHHENHRILCENYDNQIKKKYNSKKNSHTNHEKHKIKIENH